MIQQGVFGPDIQVWQANPHGVGCISYGQQGSLVHIPSDQQKEVDCMQLILVGPLWDCYTECYNQMGAAIVMEDGAPVHWPRLPNLFIIPMPWHPFHIHPNTRP